MDGLVAFRALLLVCMTMGAVGCARKASPVVLPATAPTPPSTTPPRSELTGEQRQEVMQRRREQAELRREQQQLNRGSRAPATRSAPTTSPR